MPYKLDGARVLVKKKGRWKVLKRHPTEEDARKHLKALKANVEHDED